MTRALIHILSLIVSITFFAACNINTGATKYRGYKNAIDINKISSVPGIKDTKILDVALPAANSSTFDYNKSLKDVYFLKLETTPESKINNIDKVLLSKNRIILVDSRISKGIYIFDSTGRFINKILADKSIGGGKAMISNFIDVTYDYNDEAIILHDLDKSKFFYFDNNGNFKKFSKEYFYFFRFTSLRNTNFFVYINAFGGNDHISALAKSSIYIGSKDAKKLYTANNAIKNMNANVNFWINDNLSIRNCNNNIFYTPEFSDTVYKIDGRPNIYPKLVIHYPGPNVNEKLKERKKENLQEYNKLMNTNQYYSFKGEIICNDDSIYCIYSYKNGLTGYFYSEKTHNIVGGSLSSKLSPKDSALLELYRYPVTTFNDYFVSILDVSEFGYSKWLASGKLAELKKSIKPTDNPILVFYKLKDF